MPRRRRCASGCAPPATRDDDLLAELLLYHRREAKPSWWWYFERRKMSLEDLHDDDEAIAGLEPHGAEGTINRSRLVPMRFPLQQFKLRPGTRCSTRSASARVEIVSLDAEQGTLELKLGRKAWGDEVPRCADPRQALQHRRAAGGAAAPGHEARLTATTAIRPAGRCCARRCRRSTAWPAGAPLLDGHFSVERAVDLALRLDHSTLAVQGPPGTGKTYTGAQMAVALMRAGPAGGRDRAQPQGDPQPARGDRAGGARPGLPLPRLQARRRRQRLRLTVRRRRR